MIKVAVAVPHGGAVHPQLYRAIFHMQNELGSEYEFSYCEVDMASVAKARNMMVEACLVSGVDFIHFVDDDVLVPPNTHWLYQHNADIVSGLYMARQSPHTPQMYTKAVESENAGKYWPVLDYPEGWIGEVDAAGAGCLLVKSTVFKALQEHWDKQRRMCADWIVGDRCYTDDSLKYFSNLGMRLSPWFEFLDAVGEDFYFCERAREAGFRVLVDTRVKCEHLTWVPVGEAHYKDARERGLIRSTKDGQVPEVLGGGGGVPIGVAAAEPAG